MNSSNVQDCEGPITDLSSSFYSSNLFESTPKAQPDRLFTSSSKKRKVQYSDIRIRRGDSLEPSPSTTPDLNASSECLSKNFENFKIEQNYFNVDNWDEPATKYFKNNGCEKIVTPPSTPEFHSKTFESTPKKSESFLKYASACSVASPLKEQHDILYPSLKPLKPLKIKERFDRIGYNSTLFKSNVVRDSKKFREFISNDVIMEKVFSYLSDGDLFRVSMIPSFKDAISRNLKITERYEKFKECHKNNKENYKITPPSSPETQQLFSDGSSSPSSKNFRDFVDLGTQLSHNQSLTKCPQCEKPSVLENSIGQCQNVNSCGYIFCQKCDSFAYTPTAFIDKCREITLGQSLSSKKRRGLEDLSNLSLDFNDSSIMNSTSLNYHSSNMYYSSGYGSSYETSRTPLSVKRNLNKSSFVSNDSALKQQNSLFDISNRSITTTKDQKREGKRKSLPHVAPVIQNERKIVEIKEPASPPLKMYSACSKQSKKMLKRLTR